MYLLVQDQGSCAPAFPLRECMLSEVPGSLHLPGLQMPHLPSAMAALFAGTCSGAPIKQH